MRTRPGEALAFYRSVFDGTAPREPNGCILWPYGTNSGYPVVKPDGRHGKMRQVGHLVLEHFVGPRPSPSHSQGHAPHDICGHRNCIAPEHLSWQTPQEQMDQQRRDGVIWSEEQVHEAVERRRAGEKYRSISEDMGIPVPTIHNWVSS